MEAAAADFALFKKFALRNIEVLRQDLDFELCNQPLERGDFRFQCLDAVLKFDVGYGQCPLLV
jgi:hypothetical protein